MTSAFVIKILLRVLFLILTLSFLIPQAKAGSDTLRVKIKVEDKDNPHIWMSYFAVNRRTKTGVFGDRWSEFDMTILQSDTLVISSKGYIPRMITLKDSAYSAFKMFTIKLEKEAVLLPEATIVTIRDFKEIEKDIQRLQKEKTSAYQEDYIKLQSPITALYEAFSKIEREKRKVAELEFEDAKRDLLKELLAKYVKGDIIILSEAEFDDFITFSNPDMDYLRHASQYDLIIFFKARYEEYNRFVRKF